MRVAIHGCLRPNYVSVIWFLFCLRTALIDSDVGQTLIPYDFGPFVYYIIIAVAFCKAITMRIKRFTLLKTELQIFIWFSLLILLQIMGLAQISTTFSLRNIFATICIFCLIDSIAFSKCSIQIGFFRLSMYFVLIAIICKMLLGMQYENYLPGCLTFLSAAYVVAEYSVASANERGLYYKKKKISSTFIRSSLVIFVTMAICFVSRARTALFTMMIVVIAFLFFQFRKKLTTRKVKTLYWIIVAFLVFICVAYANIHQFSWYEKVNLYSVQYFDKNIDTSRPALWKESFESLKVWQILIGAGTGKLPEISRYASASFHNTYLQLIMQNGVLGLLLLVMIMWSLWKRIAENYQDIQQKTVLAVFVGVLVYNCFEVTLLQNKAFMGMIQWIILSFGLIKSERINNDEYLLRM